MAGIQPKFGQPRALEISYTCNAAVVGGQLVERVAGTRLVQPAGAGSLIVAGVAKHDVPAVRATVQGPQVGDGLELTVVRGGVVILVTASGAITEGQKLIAAAAGAVAAAGVTPDARTVVGEAFEAAANGATFYALIY